MNSRQWPLALFICLGAGVMPACGQSKSAAVEVGPGGFADARKPDVDKNLASHCLDPAKVQAGYEYTCSDGRARKGTLNVVDSGTPVSPCTQDNQVGCLTSEEFTSFPIAERSKIIPGHVKQGVVINGVSGSLSFSGPGDCAVDGEVACVSTLAFPAVEKSRLQPGILKAGVTLAGVSGEYPSQSYPLPGLSGTDLLSLSANVSAGTYQFWKSDGTRVTGVVSDASSISIGTDPQIFSASLYRQFTIPGDADLLASNIASGVNILGVEGTALVRPADCSSDGGVGCVTTTGFKAVAISGLAAKVISSESVAGETGAVVLPDAGDVRSGVAFGAASATSGSYVPDFPDVANVRSVDTVNGTQGALANCTTDGASGCVVPSNGSMKAADTTKFNGWDIRKKRASDGSVLTFGGIQSQGKSHCRNRANRALVDNGTAPATAGALDIFDTIDDRNNDLTGLPGEIPAWLTILSNSYGADFACGGIYATGDVSTGVVGAESHLPAGPPDTRLQHDPNGNWQDVTPGVLPGGGASTNTKNGCNAAEKHCVFRELISGLMVTEVAATTYNWQGALNYCHTLGEPGNAVPALQFPMPVIGGAAYSDWRLPTQKELYHLYNAGIRGLNQTSNLTSLYGDVDVDFYSSTTLSSNSSVSPDSA